MLSSARPTRSLSRLLLLGVTLLGLLGSAWLATPRPAWADIAGGPCTPLPGFPSCPSGSDCEYVWPSSSSDSQWQGFRCMLSDPQGFIPPISSSAVDGDQCARGYGCSNPNASCVNEQYQLSYLGYCVTNYPPPGSLTCAAATNGYCAPGITCRSGYTIATQSYECSDVCCRPETCSDVGGTCYNALQTGGACPTGTYDPNAPASLDNSCQIANGICCQLYSNFPACTSGSTSCGAWSTPAANTCNTGNISRTCTTTYNSTQPCNPYSSSFNQSGTSDNCSTGYTCANQSVCVTDVTAHVFLDYAHSGSQGIQPAAPGVWVDDNGGNVFPTDSGGNQTFTGKAANTTVTLTLRLGYNGTYTPYQTTTPNPQSTSLGSTNGNPVLTFGVTPLYTISGTVFNDKNQSRTFNVAAPANEAGVGGLAIHISGGPTTVADMTTDSSGSYTTPPTLLAGTYTVTVSSALPSGYTFTTTPIWQVTVGNPAGGSAGAPVCSTSTSLDARCGGTNTGSISSLNFGITNEQSHYGGVCGDLRVDDAGAGTVSDPFPPSGATCGGADGSDAIIGNASCFTGTGIAFSCSSSTDFGLGSVNANGWQAGGPSDPECFSGEALQVVRTSYDYLMTTARESNITPTDMADPSVCTTGDLSNCLLSSSLSKGIYHAEGDLKLVGTGTPATYTFPAPADPSTEPQVYILLVHGNVTIQSSLLVPRGSALLLSASGTITVDPSVGNGVTDTSNPSVNTPNLEGFFSSDASFVVASAANGATECNADGSPIDKRLVIVGGVITNAAQGGGNFVDNRNLCVADNSCTTVETGDGINPSDQGLVASYLLTLIADGGFLQHKNFNWEEVKP